MKIDKFGLILIKMASAIIPRGTALRKVCWKIWHFFVVRSSRKNIAKYNKAVKPLLNVQVLNKHIENIKRLAESNAPQKRFYIIARNGHSVGLFSFVLTHFAHIMYALAEGMIPVIDMQNHPNAYLEEDKLGQENSWEYFFQQPCGYNLDDVDGHNCVYSNSRVWQSILPILLDSKENSYNFYFHLWSTVYRNFFKLTDNVREYIEKEYNRIIKPGMRVLGVFCRGTDYTQMRPHGHPIQPEVGDVIAKVKTMMHEWNCDYVYITADERKTVEQFESVFPNRVLSVSRKYYDELDIDYKHNLALKARFNRDNDTYLRGLEYLASVIIFTRCNSAILGITSGSMAALYINGGRFENTYIFDLGRYD